MTPEPADWIKLRRPKGKLILDRTTIEVGLEDAETIGERVAICMFEGGLSESEADEIAANEYRRRQIVTN
jgi:hypothetical protein